MLGTEESIFTVQGVGNPVPAVLLSEQAGSTPSRSSDRNASTVGNLAVVADKTTSLSVNSSNLSKSNHNVSALGSLAVDSDSAKGAIGSSPNGGILMSPFVRSSKIQRSPIRGQRIRLASLPEPASEAIGTPNTGDNDAFNRLGRKIDALCDYVKPRSNVHHEIKRLVASIKNLFVEHAQQFNDLKTVEATQAIARMARQICGETQTSPTIAKKVETVGGEMMQDGEMVTAINNKRRRSKPNSPSEHIPKKKRN